MLAPILIAGIFAIIELSYKSYLQTELDEKMVDMAAIIGVNNFDSENVQDFTTEQFCRFVGTTFLNCEDMEIGVQWILDDPFEHRNSSIIGQFDLGCPDDLLVLELNYPVSNILHPIAIADIIERDGQNYYRSRAVIRREPLLDGLGGC